MSREARALTVLAAGGYFRKALERHRLGGEKFATRLYTRDGLVVPGIGAATKRALESRGMLTQRACASSTTWPTEWQIAFMATEGA